jgi:hypothetical protein
MRNSIAAPLNDKFASDGEYDARFIDGRNASASAGELKTALAAHRPVFVATTSHGMTGPLNDAGTAPHGQAALRAPAIKQGSARSPPRKSMPRSTGWAASSSARIEQTLRHDQGQRKIAAVSRGCRPISACWWTPASRWCGRRTCWGGAARRRDLVRPRLLLGRQPLDDGIQSSGAGGLECR